MKNKKNTYRIEAVCLTFLFKKLFHFNVIEYREALLKFSGHPLVGWYPFTHGLIAYTIDDMYKNICDFIDEHYIYNKKYSTSLEQFLIFYENLEENVDKYFNLASDFLANYIYRSILLTSKDELIDIYNDIKQALLEGKDINEEGELFDEDY